MMEVTIQFSLNCCKADRKRRKRWPNSWEEDVNKKYGAAKCVYQGSGQGDKYYILVWWCSHEFSTCHLAQSQKWNATWGSSAIRDHESHCHWPGKYMDCNCTVITICVPQWLVWEVGWPFELHESRKDFRVLLDAFSLVEAGCYSTEKYVHHARDCGIVKQTRASTQEMIGLATGSCSFCDSAFVCILSHGRDELEYIGVTLLDDMTDHWLRFCVHRRRLGCVTSTKEWIWSIFLRSLCQQLLEKESQKREELKTLESHCKHYIALHWCDKSGQRDS